MNIYLLSQTKHTGYDTYDGVVVSAESEDDAREIHPGTGWDSADNCGPEWISYEDKREINVKLLGTTNEPRGVILASYNPG